MRFRTVSLLAALVVALTSAVAAPTSAEAADRATPSFLFVREGDVYVSRTDGTMRNLTRGPVGAQDPAWSPDGRRIAFVGRDGLGRALFVMKADGTGVRAVTTSVPHPGGGDSADAKPTWSPNGKTIAFHSNRSGHDQQIWRIDVDGSNLTRLTRPAGTAERQAHDVNPAWSPDGRWIWFDSDRNRRGYRDIYRVRPDGTRLQRMTFTRSADFEPDMSPDGRRVVFTSGRSGTAELHTMRSNGSTVRPLGPSRPDRVEMGSRWSADGERVLFWSEGGPEMPSFIEVVDADGRNRHRLDLGGYWDMQPDPHPMFRR